MIIAEKACKVEGCSEQGKLHSNGKRYYHKGYCHRHYQINYRSKTYKTLSSERMYGVYRAMLDRCYNENNGSYPDYGARGITVCDEWRGVGGYSNYRKYILENLGERPNPNFTLDRIDNRKGYEPDNLRWANRQTQSFNRRVSKRNKSGITGVRWNEERNTWQADIRLNGVLKRLGNYGSKEEAIKARKKAELTTIQT